MLLTRGHNHLLEYEMSKVVDFSAKKAEFTEHEDARLKLGRRIGWTGMTAEEAARPGAELLAALFQRANEDGLQLKELAVAVGVTYGYLHQLKTGLRETRHASDEFLCACAMYLNKPKAFVQALAGKVSLSDFFQPATLEAEVEDALLLMYKDGVWGGYMPLTLKQLSAKEKLFIVMLYEAATGKKLITPALSV